MFSESQIDNAQDNNKQNLEQDKLPLHELDGEQMNTEVVDYEPHSVN